MPSDGSVMPSFLWPSIITSVTALAAGFGAQWFRSHLDDEKAKQALASLLQDEVMAASLWAGALSRRLFDGKPIRSLDAYELRVRSELYDRVRERLGLLSREPRRGVEAWYQNLKVALQACEELLVTARENPLHLLQPQEATLELAGRLERLSRDGGEVVERLQGTG